MQAHDSGPAALAHPGEAANEEFLPLQDAPASPGWNAYEVWRIRVKAVYDARGQTAVPTHPGVSYRDFICEPRESSPCVPVCRCRNVIEP